MNIGVARAFRADKAMIEAAYKGDFSMMESRLAKPYERHAMQKAFKEWLAQSKTQEQSPF